MMARGWVQNGVVVLDAGFRLPEGQEVTVLVDAATEPRAIDRAEPRHGNDHTGTTSPLNPSPAGYSLLDLAPVRLGAVLRPLTADDDLRDEMLDERR